MPSLKLQSSDGEVFSVETQIAKQSNTIRTMLEGKNFSLSFVDESQCLFIDR